MELFWTRKSMGYKFPVGEVGRLINRDTRPVCEGGDGNVVGIVDSEDGGIGVPTRILFQ